MMLTIAHCHDALQRTRPDRDDLRPAKGILASMAVAAVLWCLLLLCALLVAGTARAQTVITLPSNTQGLAVTSTLIANNTTPIGIGTSTTGGVVYGIQGFANHSAATEIYVKLYNIRSGSLICGTATPPIWRGMVPFNASGGSGFISFGNNGIALTGGKSICVTAGYADNDTTAPAANTYIVNVLYKE